MNKAERTIQFSRVISTLFLSVCGPAFAQGASSLEAQVGSVSPNSGQYNNQIPKGEFPNAYTEVCFKDSAVFVDIHSGGEKTNGGDCAPGDIGWIIEREERAGECWDSAKAECLKNGMRLLEPFEFKYSCDNAATFGLSGMSGNYEWASNSAFSISDGSGTRGAGLGATMIGQLGCGNSTWEWVGRSDADQCDARPFRCAR